MGQADTLASIAKQLTQQPVLLASYTAEKKTARIPVPLKSRGQLAIWENRGLMWQTTSPFQSSVVYTSTHIGSYDERHQWTVRSQAHMAPYFEQMRLIISGQMQGLRDFFFIESHLDPTTRAWSVIATPKQDVLQSLIKDIAFFGTRYVDRILITQANGDSTHIVFDGISHPEHLPAEIRDLFEATK